MILKILNLVPTNKIKIMKKFKVLFLLVFCLSLTNCGDGKVVSTTLNNSIIVNDSALKNVKDKVVLLRQFQKNGIDSYPYENWAEYYLNGHHYYKFDIDKWGWGGHAGDCPNPSHNLNNNSTFDNINVDENIKAKLLPAEVDSIIQWKKDSLDAAMHNYYGC